MLRCVLLLVFASPLLTLAPVPAYTTAHTPTASTHTSHSIALAVQVEGVKHSPPQQASLTALSHIDRRSLPTPTPAAPSTILGPVRAGPFVYPVTQAQFGTNAYSTGEAFIGALPDRYTDALLIQTRNSHRTRTDSVYVTFDLRQALHVFVGYDDRATALPAWLSDWHDTGTFISTEGPDAATLRLYQKGFDVGRIELGGNMQPPAAGAQVNYIALIVPTVRTDAEDEHPLQALHLDAPFPNPTAAITTLHYSVPQATPATITVYDLLGRPVAILADGLHAPGRHTARLNTSTWAPGLYLVRLHTPQHQATQRLLVTH